MYSLVDCHSFYCSCERVFQPKFRKAAMVVLSNNDGCAIARTQEAKDMGVAMGTPAFMLDKMIREKKLVAFSSNYTLYQDMSDRVMAILSGFVQDMEVYSIDEAFLDLSGFVYKNLYQFGQQIRQTVLQYTGIPVGVGIAPTKTLAKMANRYAKKRFRQVSVYCADSPARIQAMLDDTNVEDIWGIGGQRAKLLMRNGIKTAADLVKAPDTWILKNMNVTGQRLLNELRGIPCIGWELESPPKKSICTSRSFGKLFSDKNIIEQAVADYAENCGSKLRREGSVASTMNVFLQTNPHRLQDAQYFRSVRLQLPIATSATPKLIQHALHGLDLIYQPGYLYMKAGVEVGAISTADTIQMGLFSDADTDKEKHILKVYDELNGYFGRGSLQFAKQGFAKPYALRAAHLSKRFTTRIEDVVKVK